MKLDILLSCMHQTDDSLIHSSKITGDAVVINQCDKNDFTEYKTQNGTVKFFSTTDRGLTKSRNEAIEKSNADVCLLCDDDEVFVDDYDSKIINAYKNLPLADVIIFKMANRSPSFKDKVIRLKFPKTMKVSSWQISFKRESLLKTGVRFDLFLGAGSGNGAEEELKFLLDCQRSGLKIYYVPEVIASVAQTQSTWFKGFSEEFFENRGTTTRYILGPVISTLYAVYYAIFKYKLYKNDISFFKALGSTLKGIRKNKIAKQKERT